MRKVIVLGLIIVFLLCACNTKNTDTNSNSNSSQSNTENTQNTKKEKEIFAEFDIVKLADGEKISIKPDKPIVAQYGYKDSHCVLFEISELYIECDILDNIFVLDIKCKGKCNDILYTDEYLNFKEATDTPDYYAIIFALYDFEGNIVGSDMLLDKCFVGQEINGETLITIDNPQSEYNNCKLVLYNDVR